MALQRCQALAPPRFPVTAEPSTPAEGLGVADSSGTDEGAWAVGAAAQDRQLFAAFQPGSPESLGATEVAGGARGGLATESLSCPRFNTCP